MTPVIFLSSEALLLIKHTLYPDWNRGDVYLTLIILKAEIFAKALRSIEYVYNCEKSQAWIVKLILWKTRSFDIDSYEKI